MVRGAHRYLLVAAEPYETIGFKVPADEIDKAPGKFYSNWNKATFVFTVRRVASVCARLARPTLPPTRRPSV